MLKDVFLSYSHPVPPPHPAMSLSERAQWGALFLIEIVRQRASEALFRVLLREKCCPVGGLLPAPESLPQPLSHLWPCTGSLLGVEPGEAQETPSVLPQPLAPSF
jgi:hypothetical protein